MDDGDVKERCTACGDDKVSFDTRNTSKDDEQIAGPACLDYRKTVIAQYANSPTMLSLLDGIDKEIKVCGFFDDFYRTVWNINTASGFGLDIWGVIVGVNRTVRTFMGFYWGFKEESLLIARPYYDMTGYNDSLNNPAQMEQYETAVGMFRDYQGKDGDGRDLMEEYTFDDDDFRKLILAKAYANISNYSISSINFLLMTLLGDNKYCTECDDKREIYILDNLDMTLIVKLNWLPTKREVAIIYNTGLLSRPAGVEMYDIDVQIKES